MEPGTPNAIGERTRRPSSDLVPPSSSTGLQPRTAAALSYLAGPFSGVLILLAESRDEDVRFHAWQSVIALGGLAVALLLVYGLAIGALFVSAAAVSAMIGLASALWVVLIVVWALCLYKAHNGGRWKLPLVGDLAERRIVSRV